MREICHATIAGVIMASTTAAIADPNHVPGAMTVGRPGIAQQVTRTIEIAMGDKMRYTPEIIDVRSGDTVRFVVHNVGQTRHEFMLGTWKELKDHAVIMHDHPEMKHDGPNAVSVEPGRTGEMVWQFTHSGRFLYGCLILGHYEAGMVGHVEVLEIRHGTGTTPAYMAPTK